MKDSFKLLQPSLTRRTSLYRRRFLGSKPFRHVVVKDAFDPPLTRRLRAVLLKEKFKRNTSRLYQTHWLSLDCVKSRLVQQWCLAFIREMTPWIESVTKIKVSRLWTIMQFYRYRNGDYLQVHNDRLGKRAVAFILNLSNFKAHEGGRLLLYGAGRRNSNRRVRKRIPHRFNSLILFEISPKSLHGLEPLKAAKKRLTLSGWLLHRGFDREFFKRLKRLRPQRKKSNRLR